MNDNNRHLKRLLAFVLSAALVITYMPSSMFTYADGENGQHEKVAEETVDETADTGDAEDISLAEAPIETPAADETDAASGTVPENNEPPAVEEENDTEIIGTPETEVPESKPEGAPEEAAPEAGRGDTEEGRQEEPAEARDAEPKAASGEEAAEVFTVTFRDRDGFKVESREVASGEAIGELPEIPSASQRDGYTAFWAVGTYDSSGQGSWTAGDPVTENDPVTEDMDIIPDYEKIVYTVTFYQNEDDTDAYATKTVDVDTNFSLNDIPAAPSKAGYAGKWVYSGGDFSNAVTITGDTRVWAEYEQNEFTVTYVVDGADYQTDTYQSGEELELPAEPNVEGKTFLGWFVGETEYTGGEAVTSDLTITAKFDTMYTVRFLVLDDEGAEIESLTQFFEKSEGEPIGIIPEKPFVAGKTFEKWVDQETGEEVTADTIVAGDITAVAQFHEIEVDTITAHYYYFASNGEKITFETQIFSVDGDDLPYTITAPSSTQTEEEYVPGAPLYYPSTPTLTVDHEDFTDGECTVEIEYVAYTATYDYVYKLKDLTGDGYTEIERKTVNGVLNSTVTPDIVEYDYAIFESAETATIEQAEGQELNVYYTRKNYSVSYETNGGSYVSGATVPYGTDYALTGSTPARDGYDFAGWYLDEELTQPAGSSVTIEGDTTIYAKWTGKQIGYTILYMKEVYDNATGTTSYVYENSRSATGTVGTKAYAASAPNIPGTLNGYVRDEDMNGTASSGGTGESTEVTIEADGSTTLKVYYSLIRYTLVFNLNNNNGLIVMNGQTYTGNSYRITDVVLGQDISSMWPSSSNEVYSTATTGNRYFNGWTGASEGTYVTKRYELIWSNVSGANSQHVMTFTASWANQSADRDAHYWLQQPDGTWQIADEYTQTGLNTTNLGPKNIDGYTQHNGNAGRPNNSYPNSGNADVQVWVDEYTDTYTDGGGHTSATPTAAQRTVTRTVDGISVTYTFDHAERYTEWFQTRYRYVYTGTVPGHNRTVQKYVYNFYYDRAQYDILYYYNGTRIHTNANIFFEADISGSTYNYTPNRPEGVDDDYTWGGWYADSALQTPYTFGTMPGNDLPLYAKWNAPSYTVNFEMDGGTPQADSQTVEKYHKVTKPANPTKEGYKFEGWFTTSDGSTLFDWNTQITQDTTIYAHWTKEPLSYTVHYVDEEGAELATSKTVTNANYEEGDVVTEQAVTVTGYKPDAGSKTLTLGLDSSANEITFVYSKKTEKTKYTVRYILDPAEHGGETIKVAPDKVKQDVDGDTLSVIETAIAVPDSFYTENPEFAGETFYPDEAEKELVLGADEEQNVLTFVYSQFKSTKITVSYVDMDGNEIQPSEVKTSKIGQTYTLSRKSISGWELNKAVVGTSYDGEEASTSYRITESGELVFTLFYQKKLTITAKSDSKQYDGTALKLPDDIDGQITYSGLKDGHSISSIALEFTGADNDTEDGRVNAGSATVTPNNAVVDGPSRADYYKIHYSSGTLTVTKVNVTIRIEPDRWTGNTYDGTVKEAGFTNGSKTLADYIQISNARYAEQYSEAIWSTIIEKNGLEPATSGGGLGYYAVAEKDADTYNYTIELTTSDLPENDNYSVNLYVRDGLLQILPKEITVTTGSDEKAYDGDPLTNDEASIEGLIAADADKVTVAATGSRTDVGDSDNTYEIDWGDVKSTNYTINEDLGTLTVTAAVLTVTVKDKELPYNGQQQEGRGFADEVTGTGEAVDTDDYTVEGLGKGDVLTIAYVPAKGTNFGVYTGSFAEIYTILNADGDDVTGNYSAVTFDPGKLNITKAELTISAIDQTYTYNGSPQGEEAATYTEGLDAKVTAEGLKGDDALTSITLNGQKTNAGEYPGEIVPSAAQVGDATNNYTIVYTNGKLTIDPKAVTVTAKDKEFTYTGEAQSWSEYEVEGLVGSDAIEAVVTGSITFPSESPVDNVVESYEFTTGTPDNYTVTTADGKLTMKNASVAITITAASDRWDYDGENHSNDAVTVTSGELLTGDTLVAAATGSVKNVADTAEGNNPIADGYRIMHGDEDVTDSYVITPEAGTLTIDPKAVTITAENKAFIYTGEAQSWPEYSVDGLVGDDAVTAVVEGSITFPSESPVTNKLASYEFTTGTPGNYTVETIDGELTMTNAEVEITITAASDEWFYDGGAHQNTEVTVTSGELLPGDELVAEATGSVTNVADTAANNNPIADGYKIMHGDEDVTANYAITTAAGKLTIKPAPVTVTAQDKEFTYTGESRSWPEYVVDGLVGSDAISATVTGSITFPSESPVTNKLASYEFTSGTAGNYTVTTADGKLTMKNASVAITITAASDRWDYDGENHSNDAVTVTSGELLKGDTLAATATGSVKNVEDTAEGNNPVDPGYKIMHGDEDVTDSYVITPEAGTLTIDPKAVTITAKSEEFTYDGRSHKNSGYDVTGLVGSDAIEAVVTGSITFPSESPVDNVVDSYEFTTGTAGNYTVTTVDGELTMKTASAAITIKSADGEWPYDGNAHYDNTVSLESGTLFTGDRLEATAEGSVTNVADTVSGNNTIAEGYKIMHGTEDVTANYEITAVNGTLTIKPAPVTVTAQDKEFTYTGEAQSWPEYVVDGLVGSDAISATVTGSITFPSESPVTNKLASYEFTSGTPGNYTVTTADGKLTMKNASVAITITAASDRWTYDGGNHSNDAVTVTSGELLKGDTLVATATGSVKNAADTAEGNNPVDPGYKIMHGDEDVTDSYVITPEAGTLTIDPKAVTITAENKAFIYTGEAQSWPEYNVDGLVGDDAISATVTGSITFPTQSPVDNVVESYEFTTGTPGNYTVETIDGKLTMTNAEVAITITAASDEWVYDGGPHQNTEVTITSGELLPGDMLVAEANGSVTNVADTAANNNPVKFGYKIMHGTEDVTANYAITAVAGKLTIKPAPVTVTAQDKEFTYTGEAQSWPEYDVDGLFGSDKISATVTGSITFPSESPVTNKIASYEFTSGTAGNYTVTTADGKLTMKNASVAITITAASDGWTYDGGNHSNDSVTVTSGELLKGDTLVATATGSVKNVADTAEGNNPIADGYKIMHGDEDVTDSYVITPEAGTLTIDPRELTITADDQTYIYDGSAKGEDNKTYTDDSKVTVSGLQGSDALTSVTLDGQETNAGEYPDKIMPSKAEIGSATGNYEITYVPGKLTIETGTLTATAPDDVVFSGEEQKLDPKAVTDANSGKALTEGTDYELSWSDDCTNAGTVTVTITGKGNYAGSNTTVTYEITKAPVTLHVTGHNKTVVYDGEEQQVSGKTFSFDNPTGASFTHGQVYSFVGSAEAKGTDAGTYPMGITEDDIQLTEFANRNLDLTLDVVDGWLKIEAADISDDERFTVEAPDDVTYNGTEQKGEPVVKDGDKTLEKGTDYTLSYSDDVTNVGTVTVTITGKGNYTGTAKASYKIVPAKVKVTTASATKEFDNTPLTKTDEYTIEGLVNDETAGLNFTGSQTEVGSSENTATVDWNGTAKEGNYEVEYEYGTLTVTTPPEYEITYDLNGGEYNGSTDDIVEVHQKGEVITVHEAPTRDGYTFVEWRGSSYQPGDSYTVVEDHKFTAIWKAEAEADDEDEDEDVDDGEEDEGEPDADTGDDSDKESSHGVNTGDDTNLLVAIVGFFASLMALFGAIFIRRRRDRRDA